MSKKKSSTPTITEDFFNFVDYGKHCIFGLLKRFSKIDAVVLVSILFGIIVLHHLLVKHYSLIEFTIDMVITFYDLTAKLINLLIPILNKILDFIVTAITDALKPFAHFFHLEIYLEAIQELKDIQFKKLPIINKGSVNNFLLAFKNSKVFLQGSTIKSFFSQTVGDRACYAARLWDGTILEFVSEILKFVTFYGGYKPIPSDPNQNCNVQIHTPFATDTFINSLLLIIQIIMSLILLIIFVMCCKVFQRPRMYDI